jgi:hypothetical protein
MWNIWKGLIILADFLERGFLLFFLVAKPGIGVVI